MDTTTKSRAGRREWTGLAVLALPTLLLSLDMSVLYLALPQLSADLQADSTQQLWIMDAYGFMVAGFLITMGGLGDRIGRRRLLLIGAAAFSVASAMAAYSTSAEMLIATRAVLGIAGSTLMPSTLALISNMFGNPRQRGVAISIWVSCFMGGVALGPVLGGIMLAHFWWGAAFLMGVPVMVVLLVAGPLLLPEYRAPKTGPLDLASVALSLVAILPVVYGLKETAKNGLAPVPLAALAIGAAFAVVFVRRQRTLASPLLDLRLFANRTFSSSMVVWLLFGLVQGGSYMFYALYLQTVAGLSPLRSGLWLLPGSFAMIASTLLGPALATRMRPAQIVATGMAIAGIGNLVLLGLDRDGGLPVLVTGMVVISFGVGLAAARGIDLIIGSARPEQAGAASSVAETSGEFGIAFGVAALGSVVTAIYRDQIGDALPAGLPDETARAAGDSINGAVGAAAGLPGPTADALVNAASASFTTALHALSGIGTVLFLVLAVFAAVALRHVGTTAEQPTDPPAEPTQEPTAKSAEQDMEQDMEQAAVQAERDRALVGR